MRERVSPSRALGFIVLILGAIAPLVISDTYYLDGIFLMLLWAGVSTAWNILGGFAGQMSLGHSAYFGIAGYTSSVLLAQFHVTPWLGMWGGALLATVLALLIGWICFRLNGPFFAMATLAVAEVLRLVAASDNKWTHGTRGLALPVANDPANMIFTSKVPYIYLAWLLLACGILIGMYIERSRLGYDLAAYRDDQIAASMLGVPTVRVRLIAFVLSAVLTAFSGTLYSQYTLFLTPDKVLGVGLSTELALIAVVGGLGYAEGPMLGALILIPLSQYLRAKLGSQFGALYLLVYGLAVLACVRWMPKGVAGLVNQLPFGRVKGGDARAAVR